MLIPCIQRRVSPFAGPHLIGEYMYIFLRHYHVSLTFNIYFCKFVLYMQNTAKNTRWKCPDDVYKLIVNVTKAFPTCILSFILHIRHKFAGKMNTLHPFYWMSLTLWCFLYVEYKPSTPCNLKVWCIFLVNFCFNIYLFSFSAIFIDFSGLFEHFRFILFKFRWI